MYLKICTQKNCTKLTLNTSNVFVTFHRINFKQVPVNLKSLANFRRFLPPGFEIRIQIASHNTNPRQLQYSIVQI